MYSNFNPNKRRKERERKINSKSNALENDDAETRIKLDIVIALQICSVQILIFTLQSIG